MGRTFGLSVGVHYEDLGECVNDALSMKKMMDDLGFDECQALVGAQATRAAIMGAVADCVRKMKHADDRCWVSFSGHGASLADNGDDETDG